jgi:hypothetical protein
MIFVVDRNLVVDRRLYLLSDRARRNVLQDGHAATLLKALKMVATVKGLG